MTATLPRITARVDADTQTLLTRAAALSGMPSMNAFVVNAAVEKRGRSLPGTRSSSSVKPIRPCLSRPWTNPRSSIRNFRRLRPVMIVSAPHENRFAGQDKT